MVRYPTKIDWPSLVDFLQYKKHSAVSAAAIVKEQSRLRREAEKEKKFPVPPVRKAGNMMTMTLISASPIARRKRIG